MFRFLITIGVLLTAPGVFSQNEKTLRPEEAAVRKVVDQLFVGMKTGDSSMVHHVFHPNARLSTSFLNKAKAPIVQIDKVDEFLIAVGTPHKEIWDERIQDVEIRIDGTMAQVWAPYHFYVDNQLSHCGVNAFQLVLTGEGWKILNLTDTRRKEGCN